jgi:hypothetical protein
LTKAYKKLYDNCMEEKSTATPSQAPAQQSTAQPSPQSAPPKVQSRGGKGKFLAIGGLGLIALALPVAVLLTQDNTDSRQHAAEPKKQQSPVVDLQDINAEPTIPEKGDDIGEISAILDQESTQEAANTEDNSDETEVTSVLQDSQVVADTEPDSE